MFVRTTVLFATYLIPVSISCLALYFIYPFWLSREISFQYQLGAISDSSVRVWVQAPRAQQCRLHVADDRDVHTGEWRIVDPSLHSVVLEMKGLQPAASYRYQIECDPEGSAEETAAAPSVFRTFPAHASHDTAASAQTLSFVFSSCLRPSFPWPFGMPTQSLLSWIRDHINPAFVLLLGQYRPLHKPIDRFPNHLLFIKHVNTCLTNLCIACLSQETTHMRISRRSTRLGHISRCGRMKLACERWVAVYQCS